MAREFKSNNSIGLLAQQLKKKSGKISLLVEIEKIERDEQQPRYSFDAERLNELADDIKRNGLLQPILVRNKASNNDRYIIIAGERRFRASKLAGLAQIPVIVDNELGDSPDVLGYLQMSENLKREDLKFYEIADFIAGRVSAGDKKTDIANKLGLTNNRISDYLTYTDAPEWLKEYKDKFKAIKPFADFAREAKNSEEVLKDYLSALDVEHFNNGILQDFKASLVRTTDSLQEQDSKQFENNNSSSPVNNDSVNINPKMSFNDNDDELAEHVEVEDSTFKDTSNSSLSNNEADISQSLENHINESSETEDISDEDDFEVNDSDFEDQDVVNSDSEDDSYSINIESNDSNTADNSLDNAIEECDLPTIWATYNGQEVKLLYTVASSSADTVVVEDLKQKQFEIPLKDVQLVKIIQS